MNVLRISVAGLLLIAAGAHAEVTAEFGGRLMLDAALYDEDVTALASGTEARRLRGFVEGGLDEDWGYKISVDFAGNDVDIKDAYVEYTGWSVGTLKFGQTFVPVGLEEQTSSKYITFLERAQAMGMTPSRRVSVRLDNRINAETLFSAALYGDEINDNSADAGVGAAGRFVYAPATDAGQWHFGAALAVEEPADTDAGDDVFRLRSRPESHVTSTRLINTGFIPDVDRIGRFGLEAAVVMEQISLQAEYVANSVDTAAADFDFSGGYAYVSWFPQGQKRNYKLGSFGRTKAEREWEFGLRYSWQDLDDGVLAGGEQTVITLAANYYINDHFRLMFNVAAVDVDGGINGDESPNLAQARISFDF